MANYWYEKAAEKWNIDGEYNLVTQYYNGVGVSKNDYFAFKWYKKSALQGLAVAEYAIGYMYANGEGAAKNIQTWKSMVWNAAAQGYKPAKN